MQSSLTVIINCAGMGSRLQMSTTKSLIAVKEYPLIGWQLQTLKNIKDVRIVVGYQGQDVIDFVKTIRRDILFVFNRDYQTTGTAASLTMGIEGAKELILSLDGDLLITPPSLQAFIAHQQPALGYVPVSTEEPVYAALNQATQMIDYFGAAISTESHTAVEWSGLCCLTNAQLRQSVAMNLDKKHVYQLVEPHLSLPAFAIDAQEIDTPVDFDSAEQFLTINQHLWKNIE